jgi:hypothetical protein
MSSSSSPLLASRKLPDFKYLRISLAHMPIVLSYVIAGWSGFFVMSVELLGGRLLAPTFGSSIYVWGALITVFMLALSLGYLAGGRWSTQSPSVPRLGGILIVAALSISPTLLFGPGLLDRVAVAMPDPRFGSLLGATTLFFIPTFFSGMISPYAVRLLVQERATSGRHAGQLYFVSTFGSAAGTLLTSFYLVLWFDVNFILIGLAGISCVLGVVAFAGGRQR